VPLSRNLVTLTSWNTLGHSRPATGLLFYTAHLPQQCHNSKLVIFLEKPLKVLKCYNFLRMQQQQQHNCSLAASFANCVMTLYLLKVHLRTFLSIRITQKCQILSCDTLVANECYIKRLIGVKSHYHIALIWGIRLLLYLYIFLNV
jgi:hypothetical protein